MEERIPTPKMSDHLKEIMNDLNVSAYKLAKEIGVPVSRIQDILHDRRKVTVDTSVRLGRYFGIDDLFFIRLQADIDYRELKEKMWDEIEKIKPLQRDNVTL